MEWVSLVNQFDNLIDSPFFKEYWVPLQKGGTTYFIDLSSDSLSLFSTHYFQGEPRRWYKTEIAKDLPQFLIDINDPEFDLENYFDSIQDKNWKMVEGFLREKEEQGIIGKLEPNPVHHTDIFFEDKNGNYADGNYTLKGNCITFRVVKELIVSLLPYETEITLEYFDATNCKFENVCEKVKNIKSLVYLIQVIGDPATFSYSFRFNSNKSSSAKFKKSTFTIKHQDVNLLNSLLDKFNAFRYQRKTKSSE